MNSALAETQFFACDEALGALCHSAATVLSKMLATARRAALFSLARTAPASLRKLERDRAETRVHVRCG
jgi:hypothetical protein